MNIKRATNSQLSTTESKKTNQADNQNRNRIIGMKITWRVISGEVGGGEWGIKSIIGRYKIDRGRLRMVWEMEKPKNLYV